MKTLKTIFLLLIFNFNQAQTNFETLKDCEISAQKYEAEQKYFEALNCYYIILKSDNSERFSENAKIKIDLLLPICRKQLISRLQGKWNLKERFDYDYNSNLKFSEYLKVDSNQLLFLNKSNEIIMKIDLETYPFDYNDFAGFPSIKIGKELWSLSVREVKNEKRLRWRKHIDYNGNLVAKIDERGIIIDKTRREKALQKEIDTYYVINYSTQK